MDLLVVFLIFVVAGLLVGAIIYCALTIYGAWGYLRVESSRVTQSPPITLVKPLSGLDDGLADNLRSFFNQRYPNFEILLGVRTSDDPAVQIARQVMLEFPSVPSQLIVVGESPTPNAKVHSLRRMIALARHEILVMADSDTRVEPYFLAILAGEMSDPEIGLVTCPYRALAGNSFWSELEALGLNTEFLGGVLVARLLIGMDFALGPAIATRKALLEQIGGLQRLQDYLAEDFVMGKLIAESDHRVILSSYKIEHRIGAQSWSANLEHRLRWARSTRRSRRLGYIGQLFTNPLPLALLVVVLMPSLYPLSLAALLIRAVAAWTVSGKVLGSPLNLRAWLLLPLQDMLSFAVWLSGFFGRTVTWRGNRYYVQPNGTFGAVDGDMQPAASAD